MSPSNEDTQEFQSEAHEMLEQAEKDLLKLDQGGDFKNLYDSVFRVFHSLKGGAGMFGLDALQKHMHALENTLSLIKPKGRIDGSEMNFFLGGVDAARQILSGQTVSFDYTQSVQSISLPTQATAASSELQAQAQAKDYLTPVKARSGSIAYLIDDDPDVLEALARMLVDANIETKSFTRAQDALIELKKFLPDVILTDLKMPEMNGIEFLKEVRKINQEIPVLIVSGFIDTEALMDAIKSGVFAAIEKPFKRNSLLGFVTAALKQHQTSKMFRRGLNLLLYQFADLEDFLKANGKQDVAQTARNELNQLIRQWKELTTIPGEKSK